MKEIIKLSDVTYEYRSQSEERPPVRALDHISEEITEGQFIVVLGRNGSGKSTMARLLNALLVPTEGTVIVDGFDTSREEVLWDIRKTLGMVFQNPIISLWLPRGEDIAFVPKPGCAL
jgi:energy-coupling factor transporter ATP-binding protein EcfA2